jgi:murein DD-endopeptidase MepM/ murein hydrolase activator NlpD
LYYGFRDYSPAMKRFTTTDPIRSGLNWYAYVNNSPLNYVDPLGLCKSTSDSAATEGQWQKTGAFGEDYSNVPGATVDRHLGEDYIHNTTQGKNDTIGTPVPAIEAGVVIAVGGDVTAEAGIGLHVRTESEDGARIDYFHLSETSVKVGDTIKEGAQIGLAGDSGAGGPHVHVSKSYPEEKAPEGSGEVIQEFGRDYIDPPDLP